ncbi:MAG: aspartate carbamoyltransferase regulatory subunit [Candidatus Diapherotrites archaeon]|nr:aspartate carbamoyltransferase regulatory subunit [Candidatus Diapherotrites archaeon]
MKSEESIRLTPIGRGTVLDHLPVGSALKIVRILGLDPVAGAITIAINTESKRTGHKDLLFIENRELSENEIEKIALIANGGTWNTVRDRHVVTKKTIERPSEVRGILECPNSNCIASRERLAGRFRIAPDSLSATCGYCERTISGNDIHRQIR